MYIYIYICTDRFLIEKQSVSDRKLGARGVLWDCNSGKGTSENRSAEGKGNLAFKRFPAPQLRGQIRESGLSAPEFASVFFSLQTRYDKQFPYEDHFCPLFKNLFMPLFLMGCFPGDFQEGKRPIKAFGENSPLRSENGPLRRGNALLALMGSFRAPNHGGKRPL